MLPLSGAEQLKTSADQGTRPMSSQSGAYSAFDNVANRFQRSADRAAAFNDSRPGHGVQR
jgi:hypothetical protein